MIKIDPPRSRNSKTLSTFDTERPELVPIKDAIRRSYADYRKHAGSPSVISPLTQVTNSQKEQLLGLYRTTYQYLKGDKYSLNWIYELRNGDDTSYCPMCGNVGYEAIEHYLPESHYPEFALLSFNLIPTCTSCNTKRGNTANAPGVALSLLHPYFEGSQLNAPIVRVMITGLLRAGVTSYAIPAFKLVPIIPQADPFFPRLSNHLQKCVSQKAFRKWIKNRWGVWRSKAAKYATLDLLQAAVADELKAEMEAGGANNWTASFLRGLLFEPAILEWMRANPT
ncbi:HNH endonuclease [Paraburkholderia youngii]|uniref:HNH endonuclease n=1 Tax=Paraburkholderia youngii TaxID=2782701 RepID=A0A7Y6MZA9_9BURK|nr:HNH endonuclease [Paraburkholderia youngii]NUY01697.1 HNH endonuclease [Paraburkholderia youngii]